MAAIRQVLAVVIVAVASGVAACGFAPVAPRWKVDVINGNGPVQVGIATDRGAWIWIVPPGAQLVLLDLPESREGSIEIVDSNCTLLNATAFSSGSFTILIQPADVAPGVTVRLEPGAPLPGPANVDYDAWCTG